MSTFVGFACARCAAPAALLQLSADARLTQVGFLGRIEEAVDLRALALQWGMENGSAFHIHALNPYWARFYCLDCDKIYCKDCWRIELQFEDEPGLPGWYDCAYGTCPEGHRRMLDD